MKILISLQGLTLNQVKLQLAQEEEARVQAARVDDLADAGPSGFILLGMEIEDAQYVSTTPLR